MAVIDRIKFDSPSDDIIVWKFPSEELHLGSQLIVNQSQEALFVKGGQVFDLFGPGTHTLSTANIPFLEKLINLPFRSNTPFTAEVWYVNKTVKRNLKWGTKSPIPIIEPKYNFPVNIRAFGLWGIRIEDSRNFLKQIVGTLYNADSRKVHDYFIGEIVQRLSNILAKYFVVGGISIFDINTKLDELSALATEAISPEFKRFGIEIINFNIERISIPDDELKKFQEIFGKRMEIEQISQAKVGQAYVTMRTFDTLEKAAENGGAAGSIMAGGLGLGVGIGAAVPIGQQMGKSMDINLHGQNLTNTENDHVARLQKVKQLLDAGLITPEEFQTKKKEILDNI